MKVVILAGGLPSSIADESEGIPKPMVEIGGRPILWHIIKHYAAYGYNEFIICGGYKVNMIKEYFNDFYSYQSDITVDLRDNRIVLHNNITEDWKVTVIDTGLRSSTGSRIKQAEQYLENENFIINYGDCISDINVNHLVEKFHEASKILTLTLAKPSGRNVIVNIDKDGLYCGKEYGNGLDSWVNANIMVCNYHIFEYLKDKEALEKQLLEHLMQKRQVATYRHGGFWMPVETMRDRMELETMWSTYMEKWKAR